MHREGYDGAPTSAMKELQPRTYVGVDGKTVTHLIRQFRVGAELWTVYEDKETSASPSLVFETDRIARRVRHYPESWADLPDEELYALSWSQ